MNFTNRRSRSVFYVVAVFLLLLVIQVALYGNFFRALKAGTDVINDLSRIRGSIQRYTKLELSNINVQQEHDLEIDIDGLIARNIDLSQEVEINSISKLYNIKMLNIKWTELKSLIKEYQRNPSQQHLTEVIGKSEECWEVADANVIRQQYIVNRTAAYYKYFTVTFGINLFMIAVVLFLYKRFILNGLAASAINDSLTGIFNKGYFDEYLTYEIARAGRKRLTFSLIMFDIDHFKVVNDTYGHRRGDYALKALAEVVRKSRRKADVLARIGGEEFIVLLPDTKSDEAFRLAERIRKNVEEYPFEEIGKLTISLGVTEFIETDSKDGILKRVDSALYKAKTNGRNRCEFMGGEKNEQESFGDRT